MIVEKIMNSRISTKFSQRVLDYSKRLDHKKFVLLLLTGLFIRLIGSFLYGTQDMEWWKAFGTYATEHSILNIYGGTDKEIVDLWRDGQYRPMKLKESITVWPTQTIINFQSKNYFRTEFTMPQPPVYIYSIYLSTQMYRLISPKLINNRFFNFFMNLEPVIASTMLAWIIFLFVSAHASRDIGCLACLIYWLNPLVILNAPIQAYRDPLCALFAVLSVVMLYRKNLILAFICLVFAFMYKPTGILIAPIVLLVGLYEHSIRKNIHAWFIACITFIIISLPYIITNHFLGMIQGVLSITQSSNDLTRQSMNIWWPIQYIANAYVLITQKGVSIFQALTGHDGRVIIDLPISQFESMTHINTGMIGFMLLALFTIINLCYVWRRLQFDRRAIIIAAALQVYGYFILRAGVQINHYFILIPLLTLIVFLNAISLRHYLMICSVFFVQDLIFYGFGRDFDYGWRILSFTYLAWTTNLLALANVSLFLYLCWHYYRSPLSRTFSDSNYLNQ